MSDKEAPVTLGQVQPVWSDEELLKTCLFLRFRERLRCVKRAQTLWGRPHDTLSADDRYCIAIAAGVEDATAQFAVRSRHDGGFDVLVMEQHAQISGGTPSAESDC